MVSVLLFFDVPAKIAIPVGLILDIGLIYIMVNVITLAKGVI